MDQRETSPTIYGETFVEFLKQSTGHGSLNGSRTEIICGCPWCEDGIKKNHGHLYISVHDPIFMCHRCGESGIITKLIRQLGAEDTSKYISSDCLKSGIENRTKAEKFSTNTVQLKSDDPVDIDNQLEYLKSRLGDIDFTTIPGLVLNVPSFAKNNQSLKIPIPPNALNHIGFLTYNRTKMICRNIDPDAEMRYFNSIIDPASRFFKDFYGFKLNNNCEPTIILAEGIFDILRPLYTSNLLNLKDRVSAAAAVLGKSNYRTVYNSVLNELKVLRAHLIILSDNDVQPEDYMKTFTFYKRKRNCNILTLTIIRNKNGKDFGEPNAEPVVYTI